MKAPPLNEIASGRLFLKNSFQHSIFKRHRILHDIQEPSKMKKKNTKLIENLDDVKKNPIIIYFQYYYHYYKIIIIIIIIITL